MSTQEQRNRFEEWASEQQGYFSRQTAWAAWQAAEAATIERCAKVAEAHNVIMATTTAQLIAKNIRALLPKEE